MSIIKQYTKELYRQFKYYPTWLPGLKISLGDIGVFKDGAFVPISSLANEGISFDIKPDESKADLEYSSQGAVSITTKLAGTGTPPGSLLREVDAGISIGFSKEKAILFKAMGTTSPMISDQITLGREIITRYKNGKWNKPWHVVTQLVEADSASVLISSSNEARIDLKANGKVGNEGLDFADAGLGLENTYSKDLHTKIIATKGITPLFRLSAIRYGGILPAKFQAKGIVGEDLMTPADDSTATEYDIKFVEIGLSIE